MSNYIIKRLFLFIPTFFLITMITYLMIWLAPGDYSTIKAGLQGELRQGAISKEIVEQENKLYGLDQNPVIGYYKWMKRLLVLDFGISRKDGRPVLTRISEALPITLTLNILTILIIYLVTIPMGIAAAVRKDSLFDRISSLVLFVLYSLPTFWVGLLLLVFLGSGEYLNLFPLRGISSDWADSLPLWGWLVDRLWHLVLPVVTLTYGGFAFLSRFTRANMLEVINQQYITTAVAKGLSHNRVVYIHAFRNSLIPLITLLATLLPGLLGGSVIVESIFSIPGIGMLSFEAVLSRDIPVIMAIASISAFLTLLGILIADITYGLVDPRIRVGAKV